MNKCRAKLRESGADKDTEADRANEPGAKKLQSMS